MKTSLALACAALLAHAGAHAGGWSEPPDLSGNRLDPTPVPIDPGSNLIRGTVGNGDEAGADRDYFRTVIPDGYQLSAIVVGPQSFVGGAFSFIGVQAGPVITEPPTIVSGANLLGWDLYGSASIGSDILPAIGGGLDKIGFSGPLPSGTYTWWVQELAVGQWRYDFDFQVSAVPEPAPLALGLAGLALLGWRTRRRRALA